MARLRKPYSVRKKQEKNGPSRKYHIFFRDHLDIERKLTGTTDKATTEYIAKNIFAIVNIQARGERLTSELRDFIENRPTKLREKLAEWDILDANTNAGFEPLMVYTKVKAKNSKLTIIDVTGGHVFGWKESMKDRGYSVHHIRESVAKVARISIDCKFAVPSDINEAKVLSWMAETKDKKSVGVANGHLKSLKVFCRWMLTKEAITSNPLQHLKPLKKTDDKVRPRRVFTVDEVKRLNAATINAPEHHGSTGLQRSLSYRIGYGTGWRYNEILTTERKDITLGRKPSITVRAINAKNKKTDTNPLPPKLAKDLEQYFKDNPAMPHTKVFPRMPIGKGAAMIKEDMKLAGIPYKTDEGTADFHALRHTYGTWLALRGTLIHITKELMRHEDINTTNKYYVHISEADKAAAISELPDIDIAEQILVKTGTFDAPEKSTANSTENPAKIRKDTVKSGKAGTDTKAESSNVKPSKSKDLPQSSSMRVQGLEPWTYGLKSRCSAN